MINDDISFEKFCEQFPKKRLREIVLQVHQDQIKESFGLGKNNYLSYDRETTSIICINGKPFSDFFSARLFDSCFINRLISLRNEKRSALMEAQKNWKNYSSEELFKLQFNYGLLFLDQLIEPNKVINLCNQVNDSYKKSLANDILLNASSGRNLYEEIYLKELEAVGYLLRKKSPVNQEYFFFEDKGFEPYLKHTLSRYNTSKAILDFETVVAELSERFDTLPNIHPDFNSCSEVYSMIKEKRFDQIRWRGTRGLILDLFNNKQKSYLQFIGDAFEYNEENRLLRSVTLYYALKDKLFPEKFYQMIESWGNSLK